MTQHFDDEQSSGDILGKNLADLKDRLAAIPQNAIRLSPDPVTLFGILRIAELDSKIYPLSFFKREGGEVEVFFKNEGPEKPDMTVGVHRFQYKDFKSRERTGIGLDTDDINEFAYSIRFFQALFDAVKQSGVSVRGKWNEFTRINFLISKSIVAGDTREGGNVEFNLGQFETSKKIEEFILEGLSK